VPLVALCFNHEAGSGEPSCTRVRNVSIIGQSVAELSRFNHFGARLTLLELAIANGSSVCLSVCLSVTLVSHACAVQDIEICFAQHDRAMFLVS